MSEGHEHLSAYERNRLMDSNVKMYNKPQEDDYTFLESELDKVLSMKPLGSRVLVELLPSDGHKSPLIRPFHFIKVSRSKVISVGEDVYDRIKPGVELVHQHRCGLQIGFYGLSRVFRIIPERLIMAVNNDL